MIASVKPPNMTVYRAYPKNDQLLVAAYYAIVQKGLGVGLAPPEVIRETYTRMANGTITKSEWFAIRAQAGPVFALCEQICG